MKRFAVWPVALSLLFLGACVPYYVDYPGTYEPTPSVVEVPILPPVVVLERPYYSYGGFYYYWDSGRDVWTYSRSNRGPWYQLPPSHQPERFQYRGQWHEGRGRERGRGERGERMERER